MSTSDTDFAVMDNRFPDFAEFRSVLNSRAQNELDVGFRFEEGRPVHVARAPGRLDVMGGIADYSGALVLQLPIKEATFAAAQRTSEPEIRLVSLSAMDTEPPRTAVIDVRDFHDWVPLPYARIRAAIDADPDRAWAAYPLGVLIVLAKQFAQLFEGGLRMVFCSKVPEAKGVSSSAALEVAAMQAACRALDRSVDGRQVAHWCQIAENRVVGAPCGIMDQMTAAVGHKDQLLRLLCQPADVQGYVKLPNEIAVWGIDSGIRHAVSGSDYTAVRTGAFMGYRMIAELAGLEVSNPNHDGVVRVDDPVWNGYLANMTPGQFEDEFAERLPEEMKGSRFLRRYKGTTDEVTRVDPKRTYAVRFPTAHPIHENARVARFAELLDQNVDPLVLTEMGQLMYGSHYSYSRCGLGSEGTDRLVAMVRDAGSEHGLFGAKITGGGSGGTVAVLGRADAEETVQSIARQYAAEAGHASYVFTGSSDGAFGFPAISF